MKKLSEKKVFITGAASGIGRTTAIAMGKEGCRLFLTDIDGEGLERTVQVVAGAGGEVCLARAFDVGDYRAMEAFAKDVHQRYGSLDILVNVAGVALFSQIEDMRHSDWEKVIKVNLWGDSRPGMFRASDDPRGPRGTHRFRLVYGRHYRPALAYSIRGNQTCAGRHVRVFAL